MVSKKTAEKKAKKGDAPKAADVIERARFTERLPVKIDQAVRDKNGRELAGVIRRRRAVLEAKAIANQRFRGELKYFDERLDELADAVDQGVDLVDVECVEHLIDSHTIQVTRIDTGEVLRTRPADAKDKQVDLFDGAPKKKGIRPTKKAPSTVGELVAEAHAHADKLVEGLFISDPEAVLANDAGVDRPKEPKRRRGGGKDAPRTEEDRRIAAIDKKRGKTDDTH